MTILTLALSLTRLALASSTFAPEMLAPAALLPGVAEEVTVIAEYRCDLEFQLAPAVTDQKTGKNFVINPLTFAEFDRPVLLDGYSVYGTGNEFSADSTEWEGVKFVILKKDGAAGPQYTYGMLQSGTTLGSTPNLKDSLYATKVGKPRLGVIKLSGGSSEVIFQRAPIEYEIAPETLRPLKGKCAVKKVSYQSNLRDPKLGYFQKPW